MTSSKFIAGMRVAMVSGFSGHSHTEAFVEKVYKNGNFILKGDEDKKQWKPRWDGDRAERVGETSHYAMSVQVWDDAFDRAVAKAASQKEHERKAYALETKIKGMQLRWLDASDLSELEAIITRLTGVKGAQ